MINLGIRVSNSINSGRGHFERCLSISTYFSSKVLWFLDEKNKFSQNKIKDKDEIIYEDSVNQVSKVVKAINEKKINIVLLDSYYIDINSISELFKNIPLCVFQDNDEFLNASMIICPHPIEINKTKDVISLCGPRYAPISNKFIFDKTTKNVKDRNILISMGAYDSKGTTINIIKAIKNLFDANNKNIQTKIVLGKEAPSIKKIKSIIKNDKNFELLLDVKDMSNIYNNTFFAIGAPGLSHMERLYFGIPTILIAQNKVHESIVNKWVAMGCAEKSEDSVHIIEKKILHIIENKKARNDLSKNGRNLVDGKGASRIAEAMLKII